MLAGKVILRDRRSDVVRYGARAPHRITGDIDMSRIWKEVPTEFGEANPGRVLHMWNLQPNQLNNQFQRLLVMNK